MNVILYVSDSLRAGNLSCYGYNRNTSPNIDSLASDGIQFENAFSQAYKTVESSVSIATGWYPPTHQVKTTHDAIPDGAPCFPEELRDRGYTTVGVSSMVQVSERRGFDSGFDVFEPLYRQYNDINGTIDWAKLCTDRIIDWLDTSGSQDPFYLFVWSNGTHDPYKPRSHEFTSKNKQYDIDGSLQSLKRANKTDAAHVRDLYDDTIRNSDYHFGRLIEYLKSNGLYDETLIIFTADHGELLSEHPRLAFASTPFRKGLQWVAPELCEKKVFFSPGAHVGHLGVLPYDELLHVPLIIKPPNAIQEQQTCDALVETIDVMPTIAEMTGIDQETQGMSLKPLFSGGTSFKKYVYSDTAISRGVTRSRSIRSSDYKLIQTNWELSRLKQYDAINIENVVLSLCQKTLSENPLLFELPDERENVKMGTSGPFTTLQDELNDWVTSCQQLSVTPNKTRLDEETKEQLEGLGYLN